MSSKRKSLKYRLGKVMARVIGSQDSRLLLFFTLVVAIWRTGLELINQTIVPYVAPPVYSTIKALPLPSFSEGIQRWMSWDGGWYNIISENGYVIRHGFQGPETVAFFPVFPGSVGLVSGLTGISDFRVGLILNFIFTVLSVFFMYKLTLYFAKDRKLKNADFVARIAALVLLLTPASFFFATHYAEAMLVFFFTSCIYFALTGRYWAAAIMAGFASGTKSTGAILAVVILIIWLGREKNILAYVSKIKKNFALLIGIALVALSGLIAYMTFLWIAFGRPLAFVQIQQYWDYRGVENPLVRLWENEYSQIGNLYIFGNNINFFTHHYLMLIPAISLMVVMFLLLRSRIKERYWLSMLIFFVVFSGVSTGSLLSINRYILILTPVLSLAVVYIFMTKNRYIHIISGAMLYLSVVAMFIFATAFLGRYFVA